MDNITVLNAEPNVMTKIFSKRGKKDYDFAKWFIHNEVPCSGIEDLSELLTALETEPHMVVIRGALIEGRDPSRVLRRKDAWEGELAYYITVPKGRYFIMADFDKFPTIPGLQEKDRVEWMIGHLPDYCHNISYHYQWSSQAGLYGWDELRCHIWFWLEEPLTDEEASDWAISTGVLDDSPMRTVQPNYTANPIFLDVHDPVEKRSGFVIKENNSLLIPKPTKPEIIFDKANIISSSTYIPKGFDALVNDIGPRYHMPIQRAIASWIASTSPPHDISELKRRIVERINCAPSGSSEKSIYLKDRYLDSSISGAIRKFGGKGVGKATRLPSTPLEKLRYKISGGRKI